MCVASTTIAVIGVSAAVSAAISAGATAAMGGDTSDMLRSGLIGGAIGGASAGFGAWGASLGSSMVSGAGSGTTAGAGAGATAGTTTGAGSSISVTNVGAIMGGISGTASAGGMAAQNQAAINDAKNQKELMNQQAVNEEVKAANALENAEIEKMDQRRKAHMLQGKGRAIGAANGVMLEGGREEALVNIWEQDVAMETAYDNAKIQHNAELEAWGYRANADIMRKQGKMAVKAAKRQRNASIITTFGTSAASAFANGFSIGYMNTPATKSVLA